MLRSINRNPSSSTSSLKEINTRCVHLNSLLSQYIGFHTFLFDIY